MANVKEIKNELLRFGLSENQALIYLLLITHGDLRILEISSLTKIPRSSVYENLKVLFEIGLAEKIVEENFIKIRPYPLSSMRHGLDEKLISIQTQISNLENLERAITSLPISTQEQSTIVRYYKGTSGARQLLWNTLKTKDTICVYSAWGRGRYVGIKFYKSFVKESHERKIREKVLVNPSNRVLDSIRKYAGTSIGRTLPKDIHGIPEDKIQITGETFIYDNIFAQLYLHDKEINGFEIESSNFTKTQRSIFETLWNTAEPIENFLQNKS